MFKPEQNEDPELKNATDAIFAEMAHLSSADEEYAKMVEQLTKLYPLKEIDPPKQISPDTLLLVLGNLAGIVLIVGHERINVISSKALQFILRTR